MLITSGTERNSYLTQEEAQELTGLDAVDEVALIKASFAADSIQMYVGTKADESQVLKFPRYGSDEIPMAIKLATAELIKKFKDGTAFAGVKKETVSKLSWEFDVSKGAVGNEVLAYLKPYKASSVRLEYGNK